MRIYSVKANSKRHREVVHADAELGGYGMSFSPTDDSVSFFLPSDAGRNFIVTLGYQETKKLAELLAQKLGFVKINSDEIISALLQCHSELKSIHLGYGDSKNTSEHSAGLRMGDAVIENMKEAIV